MIEDSCPSLENWGVRHLQDSNSQNSTAGRVEIEVERSCFHFSSEGGGQKDEAERMRKEGHQREEMKKR